MIVSHKHRFIFIKTCKTASTSIEIALRPLLGPDDIATPLLPEHETLCSAPARNFLLPDPYRWLRTGFGTLLGRTPKPRRFGYHAKAPFIRKQVGDAVWRSYLKFAFDRNPWDRQVSAYHYQQRQHALTRSFEEFTHRKVLTNAQRYTLGGEVAVDRLCRYEDLESEFRSICGEIGIDPPELPRENAAKDRTAYRSYYSDTTRDLVARACAYEIELFGWEF
jgi:hypothetical protein